MSEQNVSTGRAFTIPLGADGSLVEPLIFERPYKFFRVICPDTSGVQPGSSMQVMSSPSRNIPVMVLHYQDDPAWSFVPSISSEASIDFALTHAYGDVALQFILDAVTTAPVVFYVYGFEGI